ncbi:MAG: Holliday junction branch migration protein RuvA [Hydrotalea sp.]|nr:Holliday junction branch migration protein RuvA [Hydrotalea sp.]
MFAFLTGRVLSMADNNLVLDVNGVGYLVFVPKRSLANCTIGQVASFFIETIVREDAIQLYGFEQAAQKKCFNTLTTVQGVGNKTALAFLDTLSPRDITMAILSGDADRLTETPGVGQKLAGRIVQELKDKITKQMGDGEAGDGSAPVGAPLSAQGDSVMAEVMAALQKLGFQKSEAYPLVIKLLQAEEHKNKKVEDLLPLALGLLSSR